MTLLYQDPIFREHETGSHPERPLRVVRIAEHLQRVGLDQECRRPDWEAVTLARLNRVHGAPYVQQVERYAADGGGYIERDTVVSPRSYDVARRATGAVCDATVRVCRGEDRNAFCIVRPPGHHALPDAPMGFCLFNGVAVAARLALAELELQRILIVDWDVHHGNGTQDTFYEDGKVAFLSLHRFPFYPGSGARSETGAGAGVGKIVNVPLAFGTSRREYQAAFRSELERLADKVRPELILVSAGFDTHRLDPIGSLGLEVEDFADLTRCLLDVAQTHAQGRCVSVLEGGYNLDVLPHCVEAHLRGLMVQGGPRQPAGGDK